MQRQPGGLGDRMEPVLDQLGIPFAQFFLREAGFPDEIWAARNVHHHAGHGLVHRGVRLAIAADPGLLAQRIGQRLTQRDGAVFRGVMLVDMQVAIHLQRHVDQRMAAELLHHVIQKADSGGNVILARSVEVHLDQDIGFLGLSLYTPCPHGGEPIGGCEVRASGLALPGARLALDFALPQRHLVRMTDDTPDSLIPYDEIVQEALRAVVGRVLGQVERDGGTLPGNHHFYITFKTGAPGVDIPATLTERFPDEMTIVLQNKFWDLDVTQDGFSVGLSFNQIPSKLVIPFGAITAFVDPAVDFGLQFQAAMDDAEATGHDPAQNDARDGAERRAVEDVAKKEDGSNVVTVDFGRKK